MLLTPLLSASQAVPLSNVVKQQNTNSNFSNYDTITTSIASENIGVPLPIIRNWSDKPPNLNESVWGNYQQEKPSDGVKYNTNNNNSYNNNNNNNNNNKYKNINNNYNNRSNNINNNNNIFLIKDDTNYQFGNHHNTTNYNYNKSKLEIPQINTSFNSYNNHNTFNNSKLSSTDPQVNHKVLRSINVQQSKIQSANFPLPWLKDRLHHQNSDNSFTLNTNNHVYYNNNIKNNNNNNTNLINDISYNNSKIRHTNNSYFDLISLNNSNNNINHSYNGNNSSETTYNSVLKTIQDNNYHQRNNNNNNNNNINSNNNSFSTNHSNKLSQHFNIEQQSTTIGLNNQHSILSSILSNGECTIIVFHILFIFLLKRTADKQQTIFFHDIVVVDFKNYQINMKCLSSEQTECKFVIIII